MSKTYEMMWDCEFCESTKLLGKSHRYCPNCGAAQDPDTRYFPPEEEKIAVEDHEYVGVDKSCSSCDAPNSAKATCCTNCGCPMDGSKQVKIQKEKKAEPEQKPSPATAPKSSKLPLIIGVIVVLAILCGVLSLVWTESKDVTVDGHSWTRSIDIEEYQRTNSKNWQDKIPRAAIKGTCITKKNPDKTIKVEDGQDCQIEKQDKGDGTYTETEKCTTKYKEIPQDDLWCNYQLDEWKVKDTKKALANDLEPKWPEINITTCSLTQLGCMRQGSKTEEYLIVLKDPEGNDHECGFAESKWKSISVGTKKTMEFRKLGGGIDCDSFDAQPE
jgi:hypothetical protein